MEFDLTSFLVLTGLGMALAFIIAAALVGANSWASRDHCKSRPTRGIRLDETDEDSTSMAFYATAASDAPSPTRVIEAGEIQYTWPHQDQYALPTPEAFETAVLSGSLEAEYQPDNSYNHSNNDGLGYCSPSSLDATDTSSTCDTGSSSRDSCSVDTSSGFDSVGGDS